MKSFSCNVLVAIVVGLSPMNSLIAQRDSPVTKPNIDPHLVDSPSPSVDTWLITSKFLHNSRTIRVPVPPGYHEKQNAQKRYPALYLNDGVTVFDSQAYGLEASVYGLVQKGTILPILVVGVNSGASANKTKNQELDLSKIRPGRRGVPVRAAGSEWPTMNYAMFMFLFGDSIP